MSFSARDLYRFDEFELSRSRRTLLRNGQPVVLLPKTFDVLAWLVENPGRVLAKNEILKAVWRDAFVEENNLTQHISLLRKALADRCGCIATIPGRGYQFTADVAAEFTPGPGRAPSESGASGLHSANGSRPRQHGSSDRGAGAPAGEEADRKPQARISPFPDFLAHLLRRQAR